VVETIRLESGHTVTGIVGSNPTLSASLTPAWLLKIIAFLLTLSYFPSYTLYCEPNPHFVQGVNRQGIRPS
jgi:hypothetical protein